MKRMSTPTLAVLWRSKPIKTMVTVIIIFYWLRWLKPIVTMKTIVIIVVHSPRQWPCWPRGLESIKTMVIVIILLHCPWYWPRHNHGSAHGSFFSPLTLWDFSSSFWDWIISHPTFQVTLEFWWTTSPSSVFPHQFLNISQYFLLPGISKFYFYSTSQKHYHTQCNKMSKISFVIRLFSINYFTNMTVTNKYAIYL